MALTAKQAQFVREYLIDLNATQAAIRAGYSEKTAGAVGHENLSKPEIAIAIAEAQAARSERTEITADQVLQELARIGFSKLTDVVGWGQKEVAFGYDADGKKLPAEDIGDAVMVRTEMAPFVEAFDSAHLSEATKAAVSEVALTKDGLKLKMHDKVSALEKIGKHLGMFKEQVEHSGHVTLEQLVAGSFAEDQE